MTSLTQPKIFQAQIDTYSGEYLNGEFDGATGGLPNKLLWHNDNYRAGFLIGTGNYYDRKYGKVI